MLRQKYFYILYFICTIYACICQDLEKFVAPILDNQKAPLVAIVDTTNISTHIVRSIEMPLREIIKTTIEFKINEELKKNIVSGKVLSDVNGQLETLQHKIDKHIGDNQVKLTDVKQDIASLRIDTEETISHEHDEILEQKKDMTKLVDNLKLDQDEKIKNLSSNVVLMQSDVQKKLDEHTRDSRDKFTVIKQDIASLRIDTGETISHEILEQKKDVTKLVDTLKTDQDEKMKNLTSNVVLKHSEVQKKVDEHIGDSRDEFALVKEDIATLRKEMEKKNLENMNYFAKIVNTVNKDLDEKIKNLTNNVEIIHSELRETILSVDNNASILAEQLVKHSNRLDALHSNIQDFSGKTSAIQSDINKVMSTANINNGLLGGHGSRLDDLNAKFSAMNSRVALTAHPSSSKNLQGIIKFDDIKFSVGINNLPTYKSTGKFVVEKEGLYMIAVSIFSDTNNAQYYIYLNGNTISYTRIAYTSNPPSFMQHTGTVVVVRQLHPNDILWVSYPGTYYIAGGKWSTLTIVKIK